jgi:toxin YoeB
MNHFFLLNEAIDLGNYEQFKEGMLELNAIGRDSAEDKFIKHSSVYNIFLYTQLCANYGQTEQVILKFIEQLATIENYISNQNEFQQVYSNDDLKAFLGIDFSKTTVCQEMQTKNINDFFAIKRSYYTHLKCNGNKDKMEHCLQYLYKNYHFDEQAIEDMLYFNQSNTTLYERLHELLPDIDKNPYQGGLGKTEALKNNQGKASKRLTEEHRLVYHLDKGKVYIHSCKGHYE